MSLLVAIQETKSAIKVPEEFWNSYNVLEYPLFEIKELLQKAQNKEYPMSERVKALVDIFEIADEHGIYDKRCKYPGRGKDISKLVEKHL